MKCNADDVECYIADRFVESETCGMYPDVERIVPEIAAGFVKNPDMFRSRREKCRRTEQNRRSRSFTSLRRSAVCNLSVATPKILIKQIIFFLEAKTLVFSVIRIGKYLYIRYEIRVTKWSVLFQLP